MQDILPTYFAPDELDRLRKMEGMKLVRVTYTVWRNVAKKDDVYEALDWIELYMDKAKLSLGVNESQTGLVVKDFNFALEQTRIIQQFRGQVEIEQVDMSESSVWKHLIGQEVLSMGLMSLYRDLYQNHVIQLLFSADTIEITLGEEGLIAYILPSNPS